MNDGPYNVGLPTWKVKIHYRGHRQLIGDGHDKSGLTIFAYLARLKATMGSSREARTAG